MANYVKISTIGAESLRFGTGGKVHGQEAVDRMIRHWRGRLNQVLPDRPDLIVVPECCDRFPEHSKAERMAYYLSRKDQVRDFFAATAREHECNIAYSAVREVEDGSWRNSIQMIDRSGGVVGIYNKNHVVIEETTEYGILCGKDAPVFDCDFGRVACLICFDLNFDELRLKYAAQKPDLLVFGSVYHGGLMQRYWAYSCRSHFVSAIAGNRSGILSPIGEPLASSTNYFDFASATVNLDCCVCHLDYNWGRLSAMKKKYGPKVKIVDPGYLGSVLVSSESDEFTVKELLEEFDLELLDDYMTRALAHHHNPMNVER
ncbi:MAG: carbon-nitrogen hydrolase family protein [Nitrospiraceae bacterium]|nr:carbon-nitrogen hydrolase family protein [Nitrospiraceae bacterium]